MRISTFCSLAMLLVGLPLHAQFSATLAHSAVSAPAEKMTSLTDYEVVTFHIEEVLESLSGEEPAQIGFRLETSSGTLPFRLSALDLRATNHQLSAAGGPKQQTLLKRKPTRQFRGQLATVTGGVALFTLDDNFVLGTWKDGETLYHLEPLWQLWEAAPRDAYIIYTEDQVSDMANFCGTEDRDEIGEDHSEELNRVMDGCLEVDIALAADFEMFQRFGSAESVENFMLNTLASAQTNYDDEFDDELFFTVVATVIATSNATDPWTNSTDGRDGLLPDFRNWGNSGGFGVDFDVATLWTNRDLDGQAIGWASVAAVCTNRKYNICQSFSNNTTFLRVLLAHELGHNFGSNHDAGNGFIMATSVSAATAWSNQSLNAINNYYQNQNCLTSCTPPAPPVAGIQTSFTEVCESSIVTFIDASTESVTSRNWQFPGGTPSSSNVVAPQVSYPGPGTYTARLTVDNVIGSDVTEMEVTIVDPDQEGVTVVFHETFDGEENQMLISNVDGQNTWELLAVGGNTGQRAAVINNFDNNLPGNSDFLISPDIDLTGIINPTLSIEYAYRRYSPTLRDQLRVTVNGSVGGSQVLFFGDENGSGNFATGTDLEARFTPREFSDWCFDGPSCLDLDLAAFANDPFVQIVVENINGYGNYMYVDNIIVFGNCSSNTLPVEWLEFSAQAVGKTTARLNWRVNQDEAHAGFTVQRAEQDNPSAWTDLAWVAAAAGAEEVLYSYDDEQGTPGKTYFYRIRQEDVTGAIDYSPIHDVSFDSQSFITVQPNPTGGLLQLIAPTGQTTFRLFDPTGRIVSSGNIVDQRAQLDLTHLPQAVYLLRVGEAVVRVVKR